MLNLFIGGSGDNLRRKRSKGCNVTKEPWSQVVNSCKCNYYPSPDCQLVLDKEIVCKLHADSSCRSAVKFWAYSYQEANNSDTLECKEEDPNYKISQDSARTCSSIESLGMSFKYIHFDNDNVN